MRHGSYPLQQSKKKMNQSETPGAVRRKKRSKDTDVDLTKGLIFRSLPSPFEKFIIAGRSFWFGILCVSIFSEIHRNLNLFQTQMYFLFFFFINRHIFHLSEN